MFPPFSLQAPCGRFNVDVGFFARVPQPDDALYEALLRNAELPSAPQCSARRHSRGVPGDYPILGTLSSLPAIMPIWSSVGPRNADLRAWRRWLWSWVMLLRVGLEDWELAQFPAFGKALVVCQYMDPNGRKQRNAA